MSFAIITVDRVDKQDSDYMHLFDKSQKAWNCKNVEVFDILVPGERVVIDYNENPPTQGRKFGTRYINRARFWQEGDGENTWPDKEPYTGGAPKSGGSKVSKDYDPVVGKRQTSANVAGPIVLEMIKSLPDKDKLDAFKAYFSVVADEVFKWVDGGDKSPESIPTGAASQGSLGGDGIKF